MFKRGIPILALFILLACSLTAGAAKVGLGSYADDCPPGQRGPQDTIWKTANIKGAMPTNEWWSSVAWTKYSENMYPHPITIRCMFNGFEMGYPIKSTLTETDNEVEVLMEHHADLEFAGVKWFPEDAKVDAYSDWSASFLLANSKTKMGMRVTAAHGSPFVYITYKGIQPTVKFRGAAKIWSGGADTACLGVTVNGHSYGIFAPTGSKWNIGADRITLTMPKGKDYLSAALLPDNTQPTLEYFKAHAYAFITDTKTEWNYNQQTSKVATTFTVSTTVKEGTNTKTIMALYPHQWRFNDGLTLLPYTYTSVRGTMKVIEGNTFKTTYTYNGILPWLPDRGGCDRAKLAAYVSEVAKEAEHIRYGPGRPGIIDPYSMSKNFSRLATILPIAEQIGDKAAADNFRNSLAESLQDYLTAAPGKMRYLFAYDNNWGTMLAFPPGFGSESEMNDHHFHYGYFTYAASALALRDKKWGKDDQWGGMIKELIRDMADWDRSDKKYPFLRNFDPYEGHSWAGGTGMNVDGTNQESSSEAINAWVGMILWGEATGNKTIRDLGVYLYTTEVIAVQNYWFNVHGDIFPPEFTTVDSSMTWGGKIMHTTWWTEEPIETKAINFMPITGGSLYLGQYPDYVMKNYNELMTKVNNVNLWADLVYGYVALADPELAMSKWDPTITPEFGETRAHTYHWIGNLQVLGRVDTTVTADTTLYAVFNKNGVKTYVAYNAGDQEIAVTFSDGQKLTVPANQMALVVK